LAITDGEVEFAAWISAHDGLPIRIETYAAGQLDEFYSRWDFEYQDSDVGRIPAKVTNTSRLNPADEPFITSTTEYMDFRSTTGLAQSDCTLAAFGLEEPIRLTPQSRVPWILGLIATMFGAGLLWWRVGSSSTSGRKRVSTRKVPAGFTIVELVTVLAIIGLLVGLLIPAVQMVRESARRTACLNNNRQIALGVLSYEAAHRKFPSGITGRASPPPVFQSWLQLILPYVEKQAVFDRAMEEYESNPHNPERHVFGMRTVISLYQCPSEPETGEVHLVKSYIAASTSYLGVNGTNWTLKDGVLFEDSAIRPADIADGLSNTLLAGERAQRADHYYGWWYTGAGQNGSGSCGTNLGTRELRAPVQRGFTNGLENCPVGPWHFQASRPEEPCSALHFWSHHPGGAVFAMCDGSVRFLAYSADDVLPKLGTRDGGEQVSVPE